MVLSNKHFEVKSKSAHAGVYNNPCIIFDARNIQCDYSRERFKASIDVLNLIRDINEFNMLCSNLKSTFKIDSSIYYKVIDCLLTDGTLSDQDLITYFNFHLELNEAISILDGYTCIDEKFYIPYEVDLFLLGFKETFSDDEEREVHEFYGDVIEGFYKKEVSVDQLIVKVKTKMKVTKELVYA